MMNKPAFLIFILGFVGLLVHHFFFFYGHFGYDDLHYAELGHQLLQGQFDWDNHYGYRVVPIFLFGLSHRLFGFTDFASALPGLLASSGILYLLYRHFRRRPAWQYLLAISFYFSLNWNLFFSDKLMPDTFLTLFFFVAWSFYLKALRTDEQQLSKWNGIVAGLLLFVAFNTKGTLILAVPLFLFYFLADMLGWGSRLARQMRPFWLGLILSSGGLLTVYFLVTYGMTGAPFTRFLAIDANHYINDCSYDELPWAHLKERLTSGYWKLLTEGYLFVYALVALAGLLAWKWLSSKEQPGLGFYLATIVITLLSINFMTISPTSYNPVCMEARHYLFLTPPMAVAATHILAMVLAGLGMDSRSAWPWLLAVPLSLFCLRPAYQLAVYGKSLNYRTVAADYHQLIESSPRPLHLYGSAVFKNYGRYYLGFQSAAAKISFHTYEELPDCNSGAVPAENALLVRNWYMDWHAKINEQQLQTQLDSLSLELHTWPASPASFQVSRISCAPE